MSIMQVGRINSTLPDSLGKSTKVGPASSTAGTSFADELKSTLGQVNNLEHQADEAMAKGATEGADGIHETMIKLEEADISTRLMLKVRSKALDAYNQVMSMQF
jgi:flagellar hook-basal body complex protein FliE